MTWSNGIWTNCGFSNWFWPNRT